MHPAPQLWAGMRNTHKQGADLCTKADALHIYDNVVFCQVVPCVVQAVAEVTENRNVLHALLNLHGLRD